MVCDQHTRETRIRKGKVDAILPMLCVRQNLDCLNYVGLVVARKVNSPIPLPYPASPTPHAVDSILGNAMLAMHPIPKTHMYPESTLYEQSYYRHRHGQGQ